KVVHELGRGGFLSNVRGRGGGISLARPANEIRLDAVMRHMEPPTGPAACFDPDAPACAIAPACRLRGVLDEAMRAFHATLDRYTVADLVSGRRETLVRLLHPAVQLSARPA